MAYGLYKIDNKELVATGPEPFADVAPGLECREIVKSPPPGDPLRLAEPAWEDEKSWVYLKCLFLTEVTHERQPDKAGKDRDAHIAEGYLARLKEMGVDPASKEALAQRAKILTWQAKQFEDQQVMVAASIKYVTSQTKLDNVLDYGGKLIADRAVVSRLLEGACKWLP